MKGFYKGIYALLAAPIRFIFNIRVENIENEPQTDECAYIVCSNHISAWDPIWLCVALRKHHPHFMAKAELFKIPLLKTLIKALGAYPVERSGADVSAIRNTIGMLQSGTWIGMFPQGTRCNGKNPLETRIRSGIGMISTRAEVGVLPVFIETKNYKSTVFGRKRIIIGQPISSDAIKELHEKGLDYNNISKYIFNDICALGGLYREINDD